MVPRRGTRVLYMKALPGPEYNVYVREICVTGNSGAKGLSDRPASALIAVHAVTCSDTAGRGNIH